MGFIKKVLKFATKNKKITTLSVTMVAAAVVLAGIGFSILKPATGFSETITVKRASNQMLPYAAVNSKGKALRTYWKVAGGKAVYCLYPAREDPDNIEEFYTGNANKYVATVIANGYPNKPLTGNSEKDYYITQVAVWICNGNGYLPGVDVPGVPHTYASFEQGGLPSNMWNDIVKLVKNAINNPMNESYSVTTNNASSSFKLNGNYYESPVITPTVKGLSSGQLTMKLDTTAKGAKIVNAKTGDTITGTFGFNDSVKILVPKSSVSATGLNVKWTISTVNSTAPRAGTFQPYAANYEKYQTIGWYKNYPVGTCSTSGTVGFKQQLTSVTVKKVNEQGQPLAGATFALYNSAGTLISEKATSGSIEQGQQEAVWNNLPMGTYTVKEVKAPSGYQLNTNTFTANASTPSGASVTVKDMKVIPKEGGVSIHKTNAANNQPLADAHFSITNSAGDVVGTIVTDANGNGSVNGLPYGTYKITETQAPKDFVIDSSIPDVTISSNKVYNVNVADSQFEGTVKAVKYSESTHKLLPGCTFGLYTESGTLFGKEITDTDGIAVWHKVPAGKYYIRELVAPNGYQLSDKQLPVNVSSANSHFMVGVKMEDKAIPGSVHFYKVDSKTGAKLAGAKFGIWQGSKLIGTTVTNADGEGTFSNLQFGKYEVKEMQAPQGYNISSQVWNFDLNADDVNSLQPFTFNDTEITTTLGIIKVNAENGNKLQGAVFGLYQNGKQIQTATTDAQGSLAFKPVDFGKYQVKELVAPTGFLLSNQVWDVNISAVNAGQQLTYTFKDKEITGLVKITKVDYTNDKPVAGAKIKVTCDNGFDKGKTWEWVSDGHGHELELPYGTYTYHEVVAPKGYQINTAVGHFSINKAGEAEQKLIIKDKRIEDNVSISKVDYTTDKPVAGAKIKVTCDTGFDKGKTWDWISNGKPHNMVLPYGTYTYEETAAPVGYQINKAVGHFEVTKEGVDVKCVIKDKRITGSLVITKENIANGKVLEGATFVITNQEGKVVAKGTTGSNGQTSFTLPYGIYYYSEYKAPEGFGLIQGKTRFEITKQGEVIKAVVKDARLPKTASVPMNTKLIAGLAGLVFVLGGVAIALDVKKRRD